MADKLEGDGLVSCIRQLIVNCEPFIREAGSVDLAEEALLHLEENDENFHKYEFVKALRKLLDEELGNFIDEEIELHAMGRKDAGYEELVERITEKIIHSREYTQLAKPLKTNVTQALDQLLANFEQEFCSRRSTDNTGRHLMPQRSLSFSDGESSFSSSFNQASLMFISQEKLVEVAEHMDRKLPLENRRDAMYTLCQIPNIDVQNGDSWPVLRRVVLEALADPDETLANLAMRFIARGFSSSSPNSREMYITLVEHLENHFGGKRTNIPKIRSGLDLQQPDVSRIMMGFRLLNDFQHQIPQYWVRYSEKFLEDIVDRTLCLFSFHYKLPPEDGRLSPVHFISVLDPRAIWFIKWMHGNYSRTPMLRLLQKYKPLLIEAVKACMRFIEVAISKSSRKQEDSEKIVDSPGGKYSYTASQLDYLYFIHSFCLLTRVLSFTNGRSFFPLVLKEKETPISIIKVMCAFVSYITNTRRRRPSKKNHLEPGVLITDAIKQMASIESVCEVCFCNEEVISLLLSPLQNILKNRNSKTNDIMNTANSLNPQQLTLDKLVQRIPTTPEKVFLDGQEFIYLQVVDIISNIAVTKVGRNYLLYGSSTKSSAAVAAHVIAQFVQRALRGQIRVPSSVVVAFIYVCRQFYCTGEGLHQLRSYDLHQAIAQAWRDSLKNENRPGHDNTSGGRSNKESLSSYIMWEETLLDNLLNFAGTPRGLMCLQQTGALSKCVKYMFSRYIKKLQVSKYEKFGYGLMLTQVAGTALGMAALDETGFIRTLVHDVWASIECGAEDRCIYQPKLWPVDTIERTAHKPLVNLLNVLSAYPAIYQVLSGQTLPNKESYACREMPDNVVELLDRIVIMNSPEKMHALFNYEQSHVFGLRMLSVLTTCLNTFLLLQTQYKFQEVLLENQRASVHEERKKIIMDALVVERNYILVKTFLIGGPNERIIPKRTINEKPNSPAYEHPIVFEYPVPKQFSVSPPGKSAMKQDNPLSSYLNDTKKDELTRTWLEGCQRAFVNGMRKNSADQLRNNVYIDLLERTVMAMSSQKDRNNFPCETVSVTESSLGDISLNKMEKLGVDLTIRYGESLKLVGQANARTKLTELQKSVQYLLNCHQKKVQGDEIIYIQNEHKGYDWFVASVFLLFNGQTDRCWKCLQRIFSQWESAYMWPHRMYQANVLSPTIRQSATPPLLYKVCHAVECILAIECPHVYSAFRMSGFTPAQLCQHWLSQCFWNYLDWPAIAQYICLPFIMGADYQVYFCVAILRHLQKDILYHQQCQDLLIFLKEEGIQRFQPRLHLEFMQSLEEKHRDTVLSDLMDINNL